VYETRVLEKIVGTKRGKATGEWGDYIMFSFMICTPHYIIWVIKSRQMRLGGRGGKNRVLVGKPKENKPLGRPKRRWEDNIKRDLMEIRSGHGLD
jgi:hypothetical protein